MSFHSAPDLTSAQTVTMRPAIAADVDWAAPLLFATGPALFSYVFASPSEQAKEILRQAFIQPQHAFSYEYTQVIEVSAQSAGLLVSYPGQVKRQADEKVQLVMARLLPLRKLPKILVNLADLTRIKQDVAPHEYYILGLSILPEFRRRGLGQYLLQQAETHARSCKCSVICLDVTYNNAPAKSLLEQMNYQVACSKTTARFEQMTRAGGIHRMIKNLT
ncbi:GNAT family N-acetyltransferase [Kovacikia minuta CCNUW1]|uniref:GNAT family N-acetyltransferase n=1 Tax=Kovacikia minuta TaxID=2931930 RepID=UPI001CCEDA63|nr:GNAT family N-acetyltransferase [Kovacikia minuta]UBF28294.1 GNAT family N-acetyltransferase [Kovacikia minuta CCNUW1]